MQSHHGLYLAEVHNSTLFDFGRSGFQQVYSGKLDSTDSKLKFFLNIHPPIGNSQWSGEEFKLMM